MMKRLSMLSAAFIGLTAQGLPQIDSPGVSAADVIAARQASLDMSSITFRSMGDAVKAGREAKSQGYPAPRRFHECFRPALGGVRLQ
jgi:hypothetical protein